MPENLERTLDMIAAGLQDEAREQLEEQGAVRSGFLRDNTFVTVGTDGNFVVEFPDYGVFVNDGLGSNYIEGERPFYSNLILEGPEEGTYENELEDMLEDAFDMDVSDLDAELDRQI